MVPAVTLMSVRVVKVWSIRVAVLCTGSYLVGVVIVVWRLFSSNRWRRFLGGLRRSMLASPCSVMEVEGFLV